MAHKATIRPVEILLVEDNPGDARLAIEAMKDSKIKNNLIWIRDGIETMQYLRKEMNYSEAQRPDLILLDLNMPRKNGIEILTEIKWDDELKRIPVVILTVSKAEEDIIKTYNRHANCYVTKPLDLEQFIHVVKSIEDFWFTIVKLPPQGKN
ncbi:MAG: response regulator [Ignavibacteriae bacterium]|nr:response regulator [Ignavibacteriota bacterium]